MQALGIACGALLTVVAMAMPAAAGSLVFEDPAGDDFGPGTYKYPTDAVYKPGCFDLRKVEISNTGSSIRIEITLESRLEDPWNSKGWPDGGNGFSLQMVQIYLDTTKDAGHSDTLPGVNAVFSKADSWDKVIIISPQPKVRLKREIKAKADRFKADIVIPRKVTVKGKTIIAIVRKSDLGGTPSKDWGVQAVMQSNDGFAAGNDLLSRRVNERPGQHRFGGGNDHDCDPHVLDILAAAAKGEPLEIEAQKKALAYACGPSGQATKPATLPMVRNP